MLPFSQPLANHRSLSSEDPICVIHGDIYDRDFASAIVNNRLYFSSGSYSFENGGTNTPVNSIYWIDLTKQFPAHSFIGPRVYNEITLPSGMPAGTDYSLMFHDDAGLYFWIPNSDNPSSMWTYDVSENKFAEVDAPGGGSSIIIPYAYASGQQFASVASASTTYIVGTTNTSSSLERRDEGTTPWLRAVKTSLDEVTWEDMNGSPILMDSGGVFYLPAGEGGVLVAFGGTNPAAHGQFAQPNLNDYRSMDQILIYDIANQEWYSTTATTDYNPNSEQAPPEERLHFCGGVSTAPDGSSWQITIYGGFDLEAGHPLNDVWVLSIPTFTWIDVTPGDQSNGDGGNYGRSLAQCQMYNDAQMIVLGGQIQTAEQPTANATNCSPNNPPLLVLNTNTFEWAESFDPDLVYSQPPAVYSVIGGNAQGGSPSSPPGGFQDSALASIFTQRIAVVTGGTTTTTLTLTSGPSPISNPGANASVGSGHGGEGIAGVVIGGVIGVALIIGLIVYYLRQRRARARATSTDDSRPAGPPANTATNTATAAATSAGAAAAGETTEVVRNTQSSPPGGIRQYFDPRQSPEAKSGQPEVRQVSLPSASGVAAPAASSSQAPVSGVGTTATTPPAEKDKSPRYG